MGDIEFIYDLTMNDSGIIGGTFKGYDTKSNELVTSFKLAPLVGCNGVCVFTKFFISEEYRGIGLAKVIVKRAESVAISLKYSVIICTTKENNEPMIKTLKRLEWNKSFDFINLKTANPISLHFKHLV